MQDNEQEWSPTDEERQFVEEVALVLERMGLFRMAGRALGWLMICDPPEQTFNQIVAGLGASKGSISNALRFLTSAEWVERVARHGQRRVRYRMREGGFEELTWAQMSSYGDFLDLTRRGLSMMPVDDPDRARRLQGMHDLFAWLDEEMSKLRERWDERQSRRGRR